MTDQHVQEKLTQFFNGYHVKTFPEGTILTFANQDPEGVSFLLEGIVEQYDITPEGNKVTVNIFKPSAFFPMSWAINKTPNAYFFAATTEVKLQIADADATVAFLQANPDVLFDLLSRVYKGTDALLQRLVLAARSASERLVWGLLVEAYRFGTQTNDATSTVTIKQQDLAARSGLARETVSRELHKLADAGLLTLGKKGIVLDIAQLEHKLDLSK